ncbi:venom dipeptidyl peptidase 4 [Pectinophora gossypiella]|uniref:venom dipeptidyl peptidase 4 n=1 Tax=Pectinophora gossypiella TaxID=13191 RepID=UPI00214F104F|nr:venom dipeptidyl peptidase 4 [Pectinophora gossypiella]
MRALVAIVVALLGTHTESSPFPTKLQTFALEEVIPLRPEFYPERLAVQWVSDHEYIYSEPSIGIRKYDADSNTYVTILDVVDLFNLKQYSVSSFSKNGKYLLLTSNKRKVYRYSSIADYSVYNLENKTITNIASGPLQTVVWGGGNSLAYVQNNNVFYVPDCSRPDIITPLTNEGIPGEVYYGVPDWIYEEEVFNGAEALWFSPSGAYLAVASFNDTNVESAVYPFYGHPADINFQYPHEVRFKYPKSGRENPVVGLRVFKPNDPTTAAWNIPAPVDIVGLDHVLGRVNWASDESLIVLWLNRRQSISILVNCELLNDKCSIVKQRTEANGWIDISEPLFDKTGTQMVEIEPQYLGEKRFLHATRFDFPSQVTDDLTATNSTITEIVGWNREADALFTIVAPTEVPWQRQLWVWQRGTARCVTCREPICHHVSAMMSPSASYAVVSCSTTNIPPKTYLYNSRTDTLKLVKENKRLTDKLSQYELPMVLFNKIPLGDDLVAHIKLLLPPEVKKNEKYPMVVRVYSGPGTTRVKDNYDLEYYTTYLATNRSFISASIDVRGSGVMGVEALFAINKALGTVEVTDTLAAIRQLLNMYSFIDPNRVGVWGWSYGGFATTMMLILDDKKTIACGAAVAPVTSWLYYDSIYTERYMDTPVENAIGYQRSDLMASAEKLRGRKFLLVHGTGDDNVHYQHSLQLAKVLQRADIAFEQMSYTDETHSLLGVSRHFYHTLDHFWTECFNS